MVSLRVLRGQEFPVKTLWGKKKRFGIYIGEERELFGLMDNVFKIVDRSIKTLFFHLGPKWIFYLV